MNNPFKSPDRITLTWTDERGFALQIVSIACNVEIVCGLADVAVGLLQTNGVETFECDAEVLSEPVAYRPFEAASKIAGYLPGMNL